MSNKRKFRIWDNNTLTHCLEQATQITIKIEEKIDKDTSMEDLPMSMIPTHILYDILVSYEAMYGKLLDENLLTAGYPKTDSSKYH